MNPEIEVKIGEEWVKIPLLPPGQDHPTRKLTLILKPELKDKTWRHPKETE